ncbi:MAG: hypothetical protein AVDCRST_MAG05-1019, partial [uncultured Rubrobacteraceae bacterium]
GSGDTVSTGAADALCTKLRSFAPKGPQRMRKGPSTGCAGGRARHFL